MCAVDPALQGAKSIIFVLTVDTEADNQWDHGIPLRTENVRYWEPFQRICRDHDVAPTYLVTSEIADDDLAQTLLRTWAGAGEAEIGAHLHPWTTPPFREDAGFRFNDPSHPFMSELPGDLVRAKLENLTDQISNNFGVRPTSFRAGRFGLDGISARVLSELGYLVDSSVTPLTSWTAHRGLPEGSGGPDFSNHSARPFIIEGTRDEEEGANLGLLEIPVTIATTSALLRRFPALSGLHRTLPARAVRKISHGRWLRPQPVWLQ
ncbi:MAG TPA: hypothetical protein VJP78_03425, partial [Thermoleophilia bacterium]|nr:hypothetical protein [Thermoleophilia bacterium]